MKLADRCWEVFATRYRSGLLRQVVRRCRTRGEVRRWSAWLRSLGFSCQVQRR